MAVHLSRWSHTLVGVRITQLLFFCSVTQPTSAKLTLCKPHELQQASLSCPSLSSGICSNSCPLSQWCHPNFLSSVAPSPFAFNLSQCQGLFQWVESSHQVAKVLDRASVSASVLPMTIQGWFPLRLTGLISLLSKGFSGILFSTKVQKHQFFGAQPSLWSSSHVHTWL